MTLQSSKLSTLNFAQLRTILELERRKDYTDRAVMGGLDKYLRNWSGEIKGTISDRQLLQRFNELELSNSGYGTWDKEKRKEWVRNVLQWLDDVKKIGNDRKVNSPVLEPLTVLSQGASVTPRHRPLLGDRALDSPVTTIKGFTPRIATKFAKLGVKTVRDLLYYFPRYHLDYTQRKSISELQEGTEQTILATVWEARVTTFGNRKGTEVIVGDETGNVRIVWFNQPYLAKRFPTNSWVVISGKVSIFKGQKVFESPEWELVKNEELIHTGRLIPVYPLTQGLYPRQIRGLVKKAVDIWAEEVQDFQPQEIISRCKLLGLSEAIRQAHYPDNGLLKEEARRRLAFDELFLLQLDVQGKKRAWQEEQPGVSFKIWPEVFKKSLDSLPFTLTRAQQRVLEEILTDLEKTKAMARLLQGEVGSGKTVVAVVALLMAAANGYQSAFMAPTEILAEQHFLNLCQLLSRVGDQHQERKNLYFYSGFLSHPLAIALLTGSLSEKEKKELHDKIKRGEVDIVVGTHALIQKEVQFYRLGLVVIDEQHRFGVLQRLALRQKGFNPHVLVMTATPIPRTMALTLYGDLDLSVIDELPPGRKIVKTICLKTEQREAAYDFLRRQIKSGRQAFIICPLIEESEAIEAKAAIAEYERLSKEIFPELRLGLLHGRMTPADKEVIMRRFRQGDLDILVSTPVVEVGIDVPNATVMLVEGADRFGLSQLHQFRGRVGRGEHPSYCLFLADKLSMEGQERLALIKQVHDGFILAEEDLKMRGPGEFFGTRQSGLPDLRMARLSDVTLLELAREEAIRLFERDAGLKLPEHSLLARELARVWQNVENGVSLGV